jgi:two-component system sensor histidine kinase RegB
MIFSETRSLVRNAQANQVGVALPWLLVLRWGGIVCQIMLISAARLVVNVEIPLLPVSVIIFFEGASNIYLHFRHRHNEPVSNFTILLILLLDTIILTGLLYVTGGAMNPFVFLYLIHIVTGAIILKERCSWLITAMTLTCYSLLLYFPPPFVTVLTAHPKAVTTAEAQQGVASLVNSFQLHTRGMSGAFLLSSIFIVFIVSKIQKALTEQRVKLQALEKERERNKRLASLATFAAGAAHELATPLSTVAVVSCEMIHTMQQCSCRTNSAELMEDARLIRKQVADCKEILYQMNAGAGKHMGEEIRRFSLQQVVNRILEDLGKDQQGRIQVTIEPEELQISMPFRSLCRTVKGLVKNGLEASRPPQKVVMHWFTTAAHLGVEVRDEGTGIAEQAQALVTEPFFTTKDSGLGLGLFLARTMAEQFGGALTIQPYADQGTRVVLTFALDMIGIKGESRQNGG